MSRIPVIALSQLPPFDIIEVISSEAILASRMTQFVDYWEVADPPQAAVYDVDALEFDPIKINQENNSYFEVLVRDRVNQACRAVTLAYASGGNLDAIASRYPSGVPRLTSESDSRYRQRIWNSPNTLSPHGTYEAYCFWAMTADATLRHAVATSVRGTGEILVTCMAGSGTTTINPISDNPTPTPTQLSSVLDYIEGESRKGLTDDVNIAAPKITTTPYQIKVKLFPGFDQNTVLADVASSLMTLVTNNWWLGVDHTRMAIDAACARNGVYNVTIDQPARDVVVDANGLVRVTSINVTYAGRGE